MIPVNKVSTCPSILTRTRQTLVYLHLTVSSKVARLTGAEVVIEVVLRKEYRKQLYVFIYQCKKKRQCDQQNKLALKSLSFS